MSVSQPKWDLITGIALARKLELLAIPINCHIALGGGVLQRGYSYKDLDIFVYPRKVAEKHLPPEEILKIFGVTEIRKFEFYSDKVVFTGLVDGRRVDFFFLT